MSYQDNNDNNDDNENDNNIIKPTYSYTPPPPRSRGMSPVIGVILMVAITVILAAVIAAFVYGMAGDIPATSPAQPQPLLTKNITVASTDAGCVGCPYSITSTEPFTYRIPLKDGGFSNHYAGDIYNHILYSGVHDFTITYNQRYENGKEIREIVSATPIIPTCNCK